MKFIVERPRDQRCDYFNIFIFLEPSVFFLLLTMGEKRSDIKCFGKTTRALIQAGEEAGKHTRKLEELNFFMMLHGL